MKAQQTITIKALSIVALFVILFAFYGCDGKQGSAATVEKESVASQSKTKVPDMDITTAAYMGNLTAINQHIAAGSDLNKKDAYGSTALIIATTFGKTDVAKALIEAGAKLNITNNDGSTALHTAAFLCRTEIVKALLDNGADKSILNNYGSTALASVSDSFEKVRPIYDQFGKDLGPFGLKLDFDHLEATRPVIAKMLQ